jgi:hypothetical protein
MIGRKDTIASMDMILTRSDNMDPFAEFIIDKLRIFQCYAI